MKPLNGKPFLHYADLVEAGCYKSEAIISKARSTGSKSLVFVDDPSDNRVALVEYDSLPQKHKAMITERFGDIYQQMAKGPIRRMIPNDVATESFFLSFTFENGRKLPIENVRKYTAAANFLTMLVRADSDKKVLKNDLQVSLGVFYDRCIEIIKEDGISLPTRYDELRKKLASFKATGLEGLIEKWRFNNSHAAKVNDEVSAAVLYEMIADNSQHDDVVICRTYNTWAASNGYKPITSATVGNHRRLNEYMLSPFRDGNKVWYNKYGKQIMRQRASAPLLLVGGDGNDWDMFFQTNQNGRVYYFDKFVLVVVMDAFNDYVLGWSIGKNENTDLIKAAWVDAIVHIHDLTGQFYLPHQLQTDHFAVASLKDFYGRLVENYHPAAARAPRGKYIERAFGTQWHQVLKQYKNYSGTNITSRKRINPERIDAEKRNFPNSEESFEYAADFVRQLRLLKNKEGVTRQEEWLNAFNTSDKSKSRHISTEHFLTNFGYSTGRLQTVTNKGLTMQLDNEVYTYDIPDDLYLEVVGKKMQVLYNPYDFTQVLITDGAKLRFLAKEATLLPAAKSDYSEKDEATFWKRLRAKKAHMNRITESKQQREQILAQEGINATGMLQAGILIKGIKQKAEQSYIAQQYNQPRIDNDNYDPLANM